LAANVTRTLERVRRGVLAEASIRRGIGENNDGSAFFRDTACEVGIGRDFKLTLHAYS
jgi:hypothetical protein